MATETSLADRAINALAMVKDMDKGIDIEHPERHAVRNIKNTAERVLSDAFSIATSLALHAQGLRCMVEVIEDSCKQKGAQ